MKILFSTILQMKNLKSKMENDERFCGSVFSPKLMEFVWMAGIGGLLRRNFGRIASRIGSWMGKCVKHWLLYGKQRNETFHNKYPADKEQLRTKIQKYLKEFNIQEEDEDSYVNTSEDSNRARRTLEPSRSSTTAPNPRHRDHRSASNARLKLSSRRHL